MRSPPKAAFRRRAAKLNVTQPAISLHLKRLETESGTSLFRRSGHRWDLNAEGQALFEATSRMLRAERDAMAILRPAAGKYRGSLVIGADGPHVAIDIVQAFCERRPDIQVEVTMDNAAGTWAALLDLKVDIAVLAGAPESSQSPAPSRCRTEPGRIGAHPTTRLHPQTRFHSRRSRRKS